MSDIEKYILLGIKAERKKKIQRLHKHFKKYNPEFLLITRRSYQKKKPLSMEAVIENVISLNKLGGYP